MSARTALPVRIGASILAVVMQVLAGFASGYMSLLLIAVAKTQEWVVWAVLLGSLAVVSGIAVVSIWLHRRSRLITWPIWPAFDAAGFVGFFALIVLTAKGD
jgi:hypothetical protein